MADLAATLERIATALETQVQMRKEEMELFTATPGISAFPEMDMIHGELVEEESYDLPALGYRVHYQALTENPGEFALFLIMPGGIVRQLKWDQ
jgi:hypothetical protein